MLIIVLWLKKNETNPKASKFKVKNNGRITKYKDIFSKGYNSNWSKEIFIMDSVLKTNSSKNKIKNLNGEKRKWSFYEKATIGPNIFTNISIDSLLVYEKEYYMKLH